MIFLTLQAAIFLIAGNLLPETQDLNLLFFLPAVALSLIGLRFPRVLLASRLLTGLWLGGLVHVCMYEKFTGLKFSLMQLAENPIEAWQSVTWLLGDSGTFGLIAEILITGLALGWLLHWIFRRLPQLTFAKAKWAEAILLILVFIPTLTLARSVIFNFGRVSTGIPPRWLGEVGALPKTDESLLIIQLESLNGSLLFQEKNNQVQARIPLEGFEAMQKQGASWFPYFWSNSFGTHFGMLNILCGTSGVGGNKLIPPPPGYMCMPERFRKAGFETTFYYSFTQTKFYNLLQTVKDAGFQNFLYGEELMKPGDPFFEWGYEDCRFYQRSLDDMKKRGLDRKKKVFTYMSVHMNHFPFKEHMKIPHPFEPSHNDQELYLNSVAEQDHCLGQMLQEIQKWNRPDLNILVVGDHSFPMEKDKGLVDGFTTSLFFLPSFQQRSKFPPGPRLNTRPSHDQIQNTVMELFGADRTPGSFLWALRAEPPPSSYESCHLVTDFGPGTTLVMEGNEMVVRSLRLGTFTHSKIIDGTPTDLGKLESPSDWEKVSLKPSCLERLGIPQK